MPAGGQERAADRRVRAALGPDVPDGVVISEAVLLAADLSTDASPAFVNGLLARIAELKPSLPVSPPAP